MSWGSHGGKSIWSIAKTGANYGLGLAAGADAVTSANVPGGIAGFWHGTPHFTSIVKDSVDALITNPNIQDPAGTATLVWVAAALVWVSGVRDMKGGHKKEGIAKLAWAWYFWAEAMNIYAWKGMALSQWVKAFTGRAVDIFSGLLTSSPKAAQIWLEHGPYIMEAFYKATPAVYLALGYYFLNKTNLFKKSAGGDNHGH